MPERDRPQKGEAQQRPGSDPPAPKARYPNIKWEPPRKGQTLVIFKGKAKGANSKRAKSRNSAR
jgi:hypothetical protein